MSDEEAPKPVFTEVVPAQAGEVSAIASASAPMIYTDWIGSHGIGIQGGVANITLEAIRNMLVSNVPINDRIVVAHLRMPFATMFALRDAINAVEKMLKEASEREKNAVKH